MADEGEPTTYEILQSVEARPLTTDGEPLDESETLETGLEVVIVEARGDELLIESLGSTPDVHWRYLVDRATFDMAVTRPAGLPRAGDSATEPAKSGGSPD